MSTLQHMRRSPRLCAVRRTGIAGVILASIWSWGGIVTWLERLSQPWSWLMGLLVGSAVATADPYQEQFDWASIGSQVKAADIQRAKDELRSMDKARSGGQHKPTRGKTGNAAVRGLRVSAQTVLRLSRARAMPASRFVPAEGDRPAGLQVAGVSGLGIGAIDGDILTHVAGAPVRSRPGVISTVMKLRARKVAAISGEFWRGQQRWSIVVEMPYPQTPKPPPVPPAVPTAKRSIPQTTSPLVAPRSRARPSQPSRPSVQRPAD